MKSKFLREFLLELKVIMKSDQTFSYAPLITLLQSCYEKSYIKLITFSVNTANSIIQFIKSLKPSTSKKQNNKRKKERDSESELNSSIVSKEGFDGYFLFA